ncbi:MAG: CBS domain-containing protein [Deltaproteobacteria bacterium]|nr:CBS domain-containing protein [Deltaproteobacteria bacterium]MBW2016610.1 CBS domain-containing protein [Deltaproteobacteria bacterium]MBW2129526.1 CBS domain-containing protein [Deltaproteobacteria bacterium]MBW2304543.1 CBS domain-containing protein [Deltaproteobacteria bacterium]
MKIRTLMIPNPITIGEKASIQEAIEVMKEHSIRHLPVVGKNNKLKGFVTLADLKIGFIPSMVADLSLKDLMIRDPITVEPGDSVESAAQLIYTQKIGGMPVVENGRLVGIITQTDILRAFIDMMGILKSSSRIDVVIGQEAGSFKRALQIIHESGGDIINVGVVPQMTNERTYCFRLSSCKTTPIREALEAEGFQVLSAMD